MTNVLLDDLQTWTFIKHRIAWILEETKLATTPEASDRFVQFMHNDAGAHLLLRGLSDFERRGYCMTELYRLGLSQHHMALLHLSPTVGPPLPQHQQIDHRERHEMYLQEFMRLQQLELQQLQQRWAPSPQLRH